MEDRRWGVPIYHLRSPISPHPAGGSGRSWIRTSEGVEPADLQSAPFGHFGIRPERERLAKKVGAVKSVPEGEDCLDREGKVGFGILRC